MKPYGWFGLALLAVAEVSLFRRVEPFYSWFYCLAWWSYILLADNLLLAARGRSLLSARRRELAAMLPLSVFVWLLFEACNLVVRNWGYQGVPPQAWLRWPGYAAAFATVLPGIFITADLIECLLWRRCGRPAASEREPLAAPPPRAPAPVYTAAGAALTAAALVRPRCFFCGVWVGPILLLDPLLEKAGVRSLSLQAAAGERRRIASLLLGGLACGILWEFWNYWAGSRWVYSVPYFGAWKIFEMPAAGFLGFPPFALECWILYHLLDTVRARLHGRAPTAIFWTAVAIFCLLMFRALDSRTVLAFAD
jgi:hypothetical protein